MVKEEGKENFGIRCVIGESFIVLRGKGLELRQISVGYPWEIVVLDVVATVVHDFIEWAIVGEGVLNLLGIIHIGHLISEAVVLCDEVHSWHVDALTKEGGTEEVDEGAGTCQVPG